ncbi:hypothetical protein [uncultured Polaribacter sp.]|uniref:hypothetical protein n=1 Tax=uncultured Polaribacter sp. TaxID=174711 RepID=UPI00261EE84C|nr:hypothetical protein [uncultured Polaribacter sp.]
MDKNDIINFVEFLQKKVYKPIQIPSKIIDSALKTTIKDIQYHFKELSKKDIIRKIYSNSNELTVFLFRLGNELHLNDLDELKGQIHWLLKELCCCEIYFNNFIGEGFYVVHGEGVVIGSRNTIGKGFIIHQGCTIGHKINGSGKGNIIGNNVTLYCNSSIIGELNIGDNTIIGAHVLLNKDLEKGATAVMTSKMVLI